MIRRRESDLERLSEDLRCRVFIGCSQADEEWAMWLPKALERHRIPRSMLDVQ
jgi:hypothetical protein